MGLLFYLIFPSSCAATWPTACMLPCGNSGVSSLDHLWICRIYTMATDKMWLSSTTDSKNSVVVMHDYCLQHNFSMGSSMARHLPHVHQPNWLFGCTGGGSGLASMLLASSNPPWLLYAVLWDCSTAPSWVLMCKSKRELYQFNIYKFHIFCLLKALLLCYFLNSWASEQSAAAIHYPWPVSNGMQLLEISHYNKKCMLLDSCNSFFLCHKMNQPPCTDRCTSER